MAQIHNTQTGLLDNTGVTLVYFDSTPKFSDYQYEIGTIGYSRSSSQLYIISSNGINEASWSKITDVALDFQDSILEFTDAAAVPPTEVVKDRYILNTNTPINAAWDGATNNDIVEFDGISWVATTPTSGTIVYNESNQILYVFQGSWKPISAAIPLATYTEVGVASFEEDDFDVIAGHVSLKTVTVENGGTGVSTLTDHGLIVGQGTDPVNITSAGIDGQIMQSSGAALDPDWTTTTYPGTTAQGDLLTSATANTITSLPKDTNATRYLSNTGANNNPQWDQIELTDGVSGILPEINGGTGESTYSNGELLIGDASNGLTKALLTEGEGIDIANASGSITISGEDASDVNKGIASFSAVDFNVNAGHVDLVYPNEVVGLLDFNDAEISFDNPSRTFTIQPKGPATEFEYRSGEQNYIKSSAQNIQISAVEGNHYISFDGVTLVETTVFTPSIIDTHAFVGAVYWDNTNSQQIYLGDEFKHSTRMGPDTHGYLHNTVGFKLAVGGGLGDILADENGSLDSHAEFSNEATTAYDEDARFDHIARGSTDNIHYLHKEGTAASPEWRISTPSSLGVLTTGTGRAAYNFLTGGNWTQAEVGNNDFVLSHVFTFNDSTRRFGVVQGENTYATVNAARDGALVEVSTITLDGLVGLEFKFVGSIIFQTSNVYTNSVKSRIRSTADGGDYVDLRDILFTRDGVAGSITDHGQLSGLLDDDHTQYVLADGTRAMDKLFVNNEITLASITAPTHAPGQVFYDTDTDALTFHNSVSDVSLQIGEENWVRVKNDSGSQIDNGEVVYISGFLGDNHLIELAQADNIVTSSVIGMVTADLADNGIGYITTFGLVRGVDTSLFSSGAPVYLSPTVAGAFQATKPTGTDFFVQIGYIGVVHENVGTILMGIKDGGSKEEIVGLRDTDDVIFNKVTGNVTVGVGETLDVDGTIDFASPLTEVNGGTGEISYINGQLLIGNGTSTGLDKARLTAGSGIRITNAAGKITVESTRDDSEASVLAIVDGTQPPPTEVTGDRYILDRTGVINLDWDGAQQDDIVEFDSISWKATTPTDGMRTFNEDDNLIYIYITAWQSMSNALPDASETQRGVVELATLAEVTAGVDTTRAVTSEGVQTKLGSSTLNGVILGGGAAADLKSTVAGLTGEVLTGVIGSDPVWGPGGGGSPAAEDVTYDNVTSGLTATDVQAAIDEVVADSVFVANDSRVKTATNAGGSAPIFSSRAWVSFQGTGTVAVLASGNVTSITDQGTGKYTVNFTTAMEDTDYAYVISSGRGTTAVTIGAVRAEVGGTKTTSSFTMFTSDNNSDTPSDTEEVNVSVFR